MYPGQSKKGVFQFIKVPVWERIELKIERIPFSGCWIWTGCLNKSGYGKFWMLGKVMKAHRAVFIASGKTIPEGLELNHLCRVTACVNPDHLEPATRRENFIHAQINRNTAGRFSK